MAFVSRSLPIRGHNAMRKSNKGSNFFVCLLFNILLNFEWSIPAWILLALHFILDIPIIWFFIALAVWILITVVGMWVVGWAADCSNAPDPPKENKNPYSVGNKNENT